MRYTSCMPKTRVAVLRGGPSSEYDVSLKTGGEVLSALRNRHVDSYQPIDVVIDRDGMWYIEGLAVQPEAALSRFDVAFNALHGRYGEDGKLQGFFETHGMPFTGSGSLASAVGMNKSLSKKRMADHDIKTPHGKEFLQPKADDDIQSVAQTIFNSFSLPVVVKPVSSGSSVGVSVVRDRKNLLSAITEAAKYGDVLVEEFIPGIEATCGVIEGFRGQKIYPLPVVEIRPETAFFDFEAKYQGKSKEIVPATFSEKWKKEIESLAVRIHQALGLRHYSRSDFIIHPKRGIYALEVNTLPGLTGESLIPKSLRAVGSDLPTLVDHLIRLAVDND